MASLLNRNGTYYADFHDTNRSPARRRHSLKTKSKRQAERLLTKLDEAYREGTWDAWTQSPDVLIHARHASEAKRLGEAAREFLEYRTEVSAPSTLQAYRSYTGLLVAVLGASTYVERIKKADVERFVRAIGGTGREPSRGSQNQRLTVAKSFFRWAESQGYIKRRPSDGVVRPQRLPLLPKAIRDEELAAIIEHVPESRSWCRPLFRFKALTGLRISELCRLKWEHVDVERRLLVIERQKNGKAQTQPVPKTAIVVLREVERRGPYVFTAPNAYAKRRVDSWSKDVEDVFRIAKDAAGIERHITPHGLRHRYCTKLAEAGASAFVIQAAARHADVNTSQRYVSIANEALREQLDRVFDTE